MIKIYICILVCFFYSCNFCEKSYTKSQITIDLLCVQEIEDHNDKEKIAYIGFSDSVLAFKFYSFGKFTKDVQPTSTVYFNRIKISDSRKFEKLTEDLKLKIYPLNVFINTGEKNPLDSLKEGLTVSYSENSNNTYSLELSLNKRKFEFQFINKMNSSTLGTTVKLFDVDNDNKEELFVIHKNVNKVDDGVNYLIEIYKINH